MKKYILIFIALLTLTLLLYPRKITHAILLRTTPKYSLMYVDGKIKKVKIKNLNLPPNTVINFTFNALKTYNIHKVTSLSSRIITKLPKGYELESLGFIPLDKKVNFYKIDKNNNVIPASKKDIIIGKNNIKSFLNKGNLHTFFIYPIKDYSKIRVSISTSNFSSIYHKNIKFHTTAPCEIYNLLENTKFNIEKNTDITASYENKNLILTFNNKKISTKNRVYIKSSNLIIKNLYRGYPSFNPSYNGVLELYPTKCGLLLINETSIDDYLCKVVPSEMPILGGIEALKCQAIAARTYALSDMLSNRFSNLGFHVDDSTRCQVYNNTKTHTLSNKAVALTSGIIITYNKEPIDAKYYSTSCGTGVNYKDIWFKYDGSTENKPYLKTNIFLEENTSLPCTEEEWLNFYKNKTIKSYDNASSYFRWNIVFKKDSLEKILNIRLKTLFKDSKEYMDIFKENKEIKTLPKEFTNLKNIVITKRSSGGNILEISFVFENVTINVKKDSLIRRCFKCNNPPNLILCNGTSLNDWSSTPSSFFSIEKSNDSFILYGGGFGHGVGMSQYGAIYLGKKGMDFKKILNIYYKNIHLYKLY